ncbi:MAG TPA: hypothetical protein VGJ15_00885 [Pirellulales bacterium]
MDQFSVSLLSRWQSLEKGEGLRAAGKMVRVLQVTGILMSAFAAVAIIYQIHPIVPTLMGVAIGWTIAETNALRSRLGQWSIFRQYIDWHRVNNDLDAQGATPGIN